MAMPVCVRFPSESAAGRGSDSCEGSITFASPKSAR